MKNLDEAIERLRQYNPQDLTFHYFRTLYGYHLNLDPKLMDLSIEEFIKTYGSPTVFDNPCFYSLFSAFSRGGTDFSRSFVSIQLYNKLPAESSGSKNFTWMDKEQLEEHIDALKDIGIDLKYLIEEKENYFYVHFFTVGLSYLTLKFVCCWIRYAYEFPETMCLLDAYRLKENIWPEETIFNLFLVTGRYMTYYQRTTGIDIEQEAFNKIALDMKSRRPTGISIREDQKISLTGQFMTNEELKDRIKKLEEDGVVVLNRIYPKVLISEEDPLCKYDYDFALLGYDPGKYTRMPKNYLPWLPKKEGDLFYEDRLKDYYTIRRRIDKTFKGEY